jgi:hypothetical protein
MSRLYRNWLPLTFAACALVFASSASAQVAGQNVNMVSGTSWPGGDPFLQRQNEPSMAVSTRNPMHILAGANDYRTVDLETVLSGGQETGDSWLGLFKSFDGGLTCGQTIRGVRSLLAHYVVYSWKIKHCRNAGTRVCNAWLAREPSTRRGVLSNLSLV